MSLRKLLNDEVKRKGYLTLAEVHAIALGLNHKTSNAERRLRKSESPDVEAVMNERGYIIGYKWIGTQPVFENRSPEWHRIMAKQRQQQLI